MTNNKNRRHVEPLRCILLEPLEETGVWSADAGKPTPFVHNDPVVSTDPSVEIRKLRLRVYLNQLPNHFSPETQQSLMTVIENGSFSPSFCSLYEEHAAKVAVRLGYVLESLTGPQNSAWKWVVNEQFLSITVYTKRKKP